MSTTFTAPIRIGTRQVPTNEGNLSAENYGASVVSQQVAVTASVDASVTIPAGAIIHFAQFYASTTDTSRDIEIDGTTVGSVATTAAVNSAVFTDDAISNVGPVDVTMTVVAGGDASAGTFSVIYTARNANGTITPTGQGYTNN